MGSQDYEQHMKDLVAQTSAGRSTTDPQVEMVIKNMWNRMKSLEGKYIDLANYYK